MKNIFFCILAILLLPIYLDAQPRIILCGLDSNLTYNFGEVSPKNRIISAKVFITNVGDDTLRITDIKPACGCTSTPIDKYAIAKGDTATLTINFRTTGYKGYVKKAVAIYTNIPSQEELYVFIECNIVYPIAIKPNEFLVFFNYEPNEHYTQKVTLTNTTQKDIKITDISASDGNLTMDLKIGDIIPAKSEKELSVTFSPTEQKMFHGSVNFKTDCEEDPIFRVYIKGLPKAKSNK